MFNHETTKRVRYGETDQMGYLYYGNYPLYYEIARTEMIRSLGMSYKEMEQSYRIMMPVMSLNIRYVRPALYDELLTLKTSIRKLPKQFITFHTEIFNEKNKLVNGGAVKLCFIDIKSNTTIRTPEFLVQKLKPYFENS